MDLEPEIYNWPLRSLWSGLLVVPRERSKQGEAVFSHLAAQSWTAWWSDIATFQIQTEKPHCSEVLLTKCNLKPFLFSYFVLIQMNLFDSALQLWIDFFRVNFVLCFFSSPYRANLESNQTASPCLGSPAQSSTCELMRPQQLISRQRLN